MHSKNPEAGSPTRLIRGGRVLNVFTGELLEEDILIENDRIAAIIPRESGQGKGGALFDEVIDATDRIVVPGYVEPHAHLGLMAEPVTTLEEMVLTGTTALVADTYALMVTLNDDELEQVLDGMQNLPTYVRWFLAPHARSFLVDEAEQFAVERLDRWLEREDVVAIGELTRWPVVEQGDPDILDKIQRASRAGKRVEGHGAGASPPRLQRLLRHGVTSDHEAITPEQVLDRLRLGFYTMLRHSSLRPDLPHLVRAIGGDVQHSNRLMLTVDGPTPVWMDENGYLDNLIRICIEGGVSPAAAYRMATLNPAMYYRIEHDVGAIAPGRRADLNVLNDLSNPTPALVMARGRVVAREGQLVESFPRIAWHELEGMRRPPGRMAGAELFSFGAGVPPETPSGADDHSIPTLELAHTVLLRLADPVAAPGATQSGGGAGTGAPGAGERGSLSGESDPIRIAVYDWEGRWMTRAFVKGFVDRIGGLATSYSPAYQVTVFGQNENDMALATARVMEAGGGLCLVEDGEVIFELALERAGLFNELPWSELVERLAEFEALMRERGYPGHEPLYTMFFFGFDSLPDYRLTVHGVWDVRRQQVVAPPLPLGQGGRFPI